LLERRELTDEQKQKAKREGDAFDEFKRLSRLHPSKSDGELWAMVEESEMPTMTEVEP
jgi:hypothetical protein